MRRSGFTLLEVLVASVLMGMLVTILTMIFNQSAIAWRTGKSGVSDMTAAERKLARVHMVADNVLPGNGVGNYMVVSPWDDDSDGKSGNDAHTRGIRLANQLNRRLQDVNGNFDADNAGKGSWGNQSLDNAKDAKKESAYIVGVRSWGPDRQRDTPDDISTWPEKD